MAGERTLTVRGVGVAEGDAVVSMVPTWSVTDAPQLTVTLSDANRRLQDSALLYGGEDDFSRKPLGDVITARYAGTDWVATALEPGRTPVVTLTHAIAAELLATTGPFSAAATMARPKVAESLLTLRGKARWETIIPEADGKKPPILDSTVVTRAISTQAERDKKRGSGFSANASFKIATKTANVAQKRILSTALSICDSRKAGPKARLALVEALIVESRCRNIGYGDATSKGVLQVLASTAQSLSLDPMDVEAVIREFLSDGFGKHRPNGAIELERKHPSWSAGQIAQACQQSAHPGRYDAAGSEARAIVKAWSSGDGSLDDTLSEARSSFQVGADANFWETSGTLATDVNRWRFIGQNPDGEALYWIAQTVVAQSRPYVVVDRSDTGVILTPGTVDDLRNVEKLSAQIMVPWSQAGFLVGRCVQVAGYGTLDGSYIAVKTTAGKDSRWVAVDLERPRNPLKRSLSQTGSVVDPSSGSGRTSMTSSGSAPEKVQRVKNYIDGVTRKKGSYLWGGAGPDRFDCSGFCSAVGKVAGIVNGRLTTSTFNSWGQAGEGEWLTFWVRETGVPERSHMYATVKENGRLRVAEAGGIKGAFTGWRGAESPSQRAGFKPRHAPGW